MDHDNPARIRALVAERDEHRTVLGSAPPDQRRELDRAQRELRSAQDENYWATYRLDAAYDRLDRIGGLSLLSRKGRQQKTSASQDIERFQGDVGWARDKVDACETRLARLADAVTHGDEWHAQNWRHQRLVSIERELTDLGHIDLRTVPLPGSRPDQSRDLNPANGLSERISRAFGQPLANDASEWWANRHPEIASPPLPGHGSGLGMDIGL